jgi:nucleoside phosphorylase
MHTGVNRCPGADPTCDPLSIPRPGFFSSLLEAADQAWKKEGLDLSNMEALLRDLLSAQVTEALALESTLSPPSSNDRRSENTTAASRSSDRVLIGAVKGKVDIGIVTVRPDEFQGVLRHLQDALTVAGGENLYEYARVSTGRADVGIVVCRCPEQGNNKAQTVTRNLLEDLNPQWVFLVGIAGGFPDSEYTLGDVIVANRLHDFSVTAALDDRPAEFDVRGGGMHPDVQKLVAHLPAKPSADWANADAIKAKRPKERILKRRDKRKFYGSADWQKKVHECLYAQLSGKSARLTPKLWVAPNASANVLMKDTALATEWKKSARAAATVEMELAGAYEAVSSRNNPARLVAIRGISDIVGYRRSAAWTEYACNTAASFAYSLVSSGMLGDIAR